MINISWIPNRQRLLRFWRRRLPDQSDLLERFHHHGLSIQDHILSSLEIVCACSLMLEERTIFEVNQSFNRLMHESTEELLDEEFFVQINRVVSEMERLGMRSHSRKLRKFGQGLASVQGNSFWQTKWLKEADKKMVSAIKDEPFLPRKG